MSDSTFNPEAFLGTSTDETGSTHYIPVPVGEYRAQIERTTARQYTGNEDQTYTVLDVNWVVLDEEVRNITGMERPQVRQSVFLDITPTGGLDFGRNKNVQLSRLRAAVGQNRPGRSWSPNDLIGQTALVKVVHEKDRRTEETRAKVTTVTAE